METTYSNCPACKSKIGSGLFSGHSLADEKLVPFINEFSKYKHPAFCSNCQFSALDEAKKNWNAELRSIRTDLEQLIKIIPIVTIHTPVNWQYETLGIVTGQTTTGTGVFSEVASSFTDFFGGQSGAYNEKLKNGEDLCMAQLRIKCLELGGNAIVGADIDYSEVGGGKGMLMVCMAGTAVRITNSNILGEEKHKAFETIQQQLTRRTYLQNFASFNKIIV
ncbi:YbjQ family protein [Pontibacter burrus]|uniref:YbjQ family protein n=1 Tax=Pontibacter burrus TaxID=2704466 RepID=A0A6B3LX62_9BACT|nr:heavy metal-binding domain-containing protein [Pontibacter burrus]NEM98210.1 YbjQ family protein [Pontibacter burrus]